MKMRPISLFSAIAAVTLALVFTFAVAPAAAATKTIKPPPPIDTRILIESVDVKAGTVTLKYMRDAKEPTHTYVIDSMTQLKVNNVAGKISNIKPGMVVDNYIERDNDNLDGLEVSGYGPDPAAKTKPKTPAKPKPTTTPDPAPTQ